jgi:hypothetical protein
MIDELTTIRSKDVLAFYFRTDGEYIFYAVPKRKIKTERKFEMLG